VTRTRASVLLLMLFFCALAGCTTLSAGEPSPEGDAGSPSVQPSTPSSAPPKRPREIRLDNLDPCTLLPEADYADYYLDKPGKPDTDDHGAANCVWFGDVGYMGLTLVTHEGVQAQEGRLGQIEPTNPIDDFPAYTVTLPNDDNRCFIAVDVAEGQYLDIQIALESFPAEVTSVCDYAHQFATSIMSTVVK
jgi:hypothetical protein